jgi:hypothetical protein
MNHFAFSVPILILKFDQPFELRQMDKLSVDKQYVDYVYLSLISYGKF